MTAEPMTLDAALREAIDYARLSPNGERRKRWEAALAAARTADPGGLRAALENIRTYVRARHPSDDPGWRTIEWMVESALTPEATAPDARET